MDSGKYKRLEKYDEKNHHEQAVMGFDSFHSA